MKRHIEMLGKNAVDVVTGFSGVITSISFDLYGCIQVILQPTELNKDGRPHDGSWFDITRLKDISDKPVMDQPNFEYGYIAEGRKGPAEKPVK